eukprot:scaffold4656_cov29-Tisochrysis_lutea.AAC.2
MSSSLHGVSVTGHTLEPTVFSARSETTWPEERMNTKGSRPFMGIPETGQMYGTSTSSAACPSLTPSPL